jgi:L-methionine (R)-S-oxide reductase
VAPADLAVEAQLARAVETAPTLDDAIRSAVAALAGSAERYHWVGVYLLEGDTLVLHTQVGAPTPHARIPVSQGLCGAAVRERRTIVVDDVRKDPRYLACSLATRSEIVVPIVTPGGGVVGEIDIDSDLPAAFGPADRDRVEAAAAALATRFAAQA